MRKRTSTTFVPGDPRCGRPKGSKGRLTAQIVQDMFDSWNEPAMEGSEKTKGQAALSILFKEQPREYAKLYATTYVPREFTFETVAAELSDNELEEMILSLREELQRPQQEPLLIEVKAHDENGSAADVERE
jgi:hypothetical protein